MYVYCDFFLLAQSLEIAKGACSHSLETVLNRHTGSPAATKATAAAKFKQATEAYECLVDGKALASCQAEGAYKEISADARVLCSQAARGASTTARGTPQALDGNRAAECTTHRHTHTIAIQRSNHIEVG